MWNRTSDTHAICGACGRGTFVDIDLEDDTHIALSDGVNLRLREPGGVTPVATPVRSVAAVLSKRRTWAVPSTIVRSANP